MDAPNSDPIDLRSGPPTPSLKKVKKAPKKKLPTQKSMDSLLTHWRLNKSVIPPDIQAFTERVRKDNLVQEHGSGSQDSMIEEFSSYSSNSPLTFRRSPSPGPPLQQSLSDSFSSMLSYSSGDRKHIALLHKTHIHSKEGTPNYPKTQFLNTHRNDLDAFGRIQLRPTATALPPKRFECRYAN